MGSSIKLAVAFALLLPIPAAAVDITACGQTVPAGEIGRLVADLACTINDTEAVILESRATLDLGGFTLSGTHYNGVQCRKRRCTVLGPGTIEGDWTAVSLFPETALYMRDVTIRNADIGILGGTGPTSRFVDLTNVTIENSSGFAIGSQAIRAQGLRVTGTSVPQGVAVLGGRLFGSDIEISDNAGAGFIGQKIKVTNLVAENNGEEGVWAFSRVVLFDSIVTGSGGAGDVRSVRRPRLVNTVCATSSDGEGGNWGVCAND